MGTIDDDNRTTRRPRALVVGLGIAGLASALRLREIGWEPVIVERAPARRDGGYFICLFGAGRAAAERLGVLDAIGNRTHPDTASWEVDRAGRKRPGLGFGSLPAAPWLLLRGDVERGLFEGLPEDVEIRYSTEPTRILQHDDSVEVTLRDNAADSETTERFDLLIGADGVRSTVRRMVFGPDANFVNPLDYMVAATLLDSNLAGFEQHEGMVLAEPGRSVWTFAFADRAPSLLFSYRTKGVDAEFRRPVIDSLRAAYGPQPTGPFLGEALDRFAAADEYLFDSAQQVRMTQWHHGRVALLGDSAWCLTLYSGFGASCGMAGADLLGTVLQRHDNDVPTALAAWNDQMRPHVAHQQNTVTTSRTLFTPHDRREHTMRSGLIRALNLPVVKGLAMRGMRRNGEGMSRKDLDIAAR